MDIITYAKSKSYTDETWAGGGIAAGKNCVINSITDITGGKRVTFGWTLDDGTPKTSTMDVMDGTDGLGIKDVTVNSENHLIITYDDDTTEDAGEISGGGGGSLEESLTTSVTVGGIASGTTINRICLFMCRTFIPCNRIDFLCTSHC